MSTREKIYSMLDYVPEYKLGYVLAYVQGIAADEEDMPNAETVQAIEDVRNRRNLIGPFDTVDSLMEALNAED